MIIFDVLSFSPKYYDGHCDDRRNDFGLKNDKDK